jgi:hypothetical protein
MAPKHHYAAVIAAVFLAAFILSPLHAESPIKIGFSMALTGGFRPTVNLH